MHNIFFGTMLINLLIIYVKNIIEFSKLKLFYLVIWIIIYIT